jgi:predicted glutamine amidotransferase
MCIAILNTKAATLKKQTLKNCWLNNSDGAGILYINDDGKMEYIKEMKDFDKFYNAYSLIKQTYGKQKNIVLHFRISTHGKVNETNCHPFLVDENCGFVHNGVIYNAPTSKEFSDTYMFNEVILKKMPVGFENDDNILDMIELYIGAGSKLVFLNADNEATIVNEEAGIWENGCWFSNTSYKSVNDWYDFGGVKKYKSDSPSKTTTTYNSGFASSWSLDDYKYDKKDDKVGLVNWDDHFCEGCDMHLYSEREIDNKVCDYCIEEMVYNGEISVDEAEPLLKYRVNLEEEFGECANCMDSHGLYDNEWKEYICGQCSDDLSA